jgi:hypothetical protein
MLPILNRLLPMASSTSTSTASRLLTKIKPRLKNGLRSMTSCLPVTPWPSKPLSFSETCLSRWVSSQLPSLKVKR